MIYVVQQSRLCLYIMHYLSFSTQPLLLLLLLLVVVVVVMVVVVPWCFIIPAVTEVYLLHY